jgi:ribosome-associated translation inhibitor RaiA
MQTTITARHCEISDALRERALAVVERLGNVATRPMEASVVFDTDGQQQTAELRLHLATGDLLVAGARRPIIVPRSDRAEEKLRKQLEKASAGPAARGPRE